MTNKTQSANKKENVAKLPEKPFAIARGDINLLTHSHNVWAIEIPTAMSKEELEQPTVWHLAAQRGFKVHDRVEIMAKNGSQLSKGVITYARGGDIRVCIYEQHELHAQAQNEINYEGFKIKYVNNRDQWCIFHGADGQMIKGNMPTDQQALKYLKDHQKALGVA